MSTGWQDIEVHLPDRRGSLAELTRALGRAGISLEGGGTFTGHGDAVAHYLVADGPRAQRTVTAAGFERSVLRDAVLTRLRQEVPGQLGLLTGHLADAGVDLLAQYSDHSGQLVLVVPEAQHARCREVLARWESSGAASASGRADGPPPTGR